MPASSECPVPGSAPGAERGRDCILLTRPESDSRELAQALCALGADSIVFPTLEIRPVELDAASAARIDALEHCRLAVFVSANAVRCGMATIRLRRDWPVHTQVAAVGMATARALEEAGFERVLVPESGNDSDALLALPALQDVRGACILVVRGVGGREQLARTLRARGARVHYLEAYVRAVPEVDAVPVRSAIAEGRVRATVAASAEGVRNLIHLLGPDAADQLRACPLLVHHARIAAAAAALGFQCAEVVPAETQALLPVLRQHLRGA